MNDDDMKRIEEFNHRFNQIQVSLEWLKGAVAILQQEIIRLRESQSESNSSSDLANEVSSISGAPLSCSDTNSDENMREDAQNTIDSMGNAIQELKNKLKQSEWEINELKEFELLRDPVTTLLYNRALDDIWIGIMGDIRQDLIKVYSDTEDGLDEPKAMRALDSLDRSVFCNLPNISRLKSRIEEDGTRSLKAIYLLAANQKEIVERLKRQGLEVIDPIENSEFIEAEHESKRNIITTDPVRHNKIARVNRPGYRYNQKILRKTEVERYLFNG